MPAIKILDRKPSESHRHNKVFQTFGSINTYVRKVHDARGAFYAIVDENQLEDILTEQNKDEFRRQGFELLDPIEFNSLKTAVVRGLDSMIGGYSDDEIVENIHQLNDWAEVESVYRLPTTSKILKVKFKNQTMVQTALKKGMVILYQNIPHYNIEREVFVKLQPCTNCFKYDHRVKDCSEPKTMKCTFCSGPHKQSECREKTPRCINCGGEHRVYAAACPTRKKLIKERSKAIRDRSRSRSRNPPQTYAAAAAAGAGQPAAGGGGAGVGGRRASALEKRNKKAGDDDFVSSRIWTLYGGYRAWFF